LLGVVLGSGADGLLELYFILRFSVYLVEKVVLLDVRIAYHLVGSQVKIGLVHFMVIQIILCRLAINRDM